MWRGGDLKGRGIEAEQIFWGTCWVWQTDDGDQDYNGATEGHRQGYCTDTFGNNSQGFLIRIITQNWDLENLNENQCDVIFSKHD
jgi:hypothetical protein